MATIITKNSSTASAAPAVGDLTKGELAVNVTDKKLYTKDNSAAIVKIVGSLGNQEANAVAITGGSVTGITDITVADGGTGASSAADARTNLGVTATGADTAYAFRSNNLSDLASASTARTNLGLGTIATQAASSVTITGGSVTGITDITVADGGTGASTAANARTNLGLVIGTDVLAPNGSAANLTSFPTLNQNTTGNAATVTTNANLTGAVTSVGNATSLGSFSSSNLAGALTDETGSGSAVFATSPTLVTPILGTPTSATLTNATGLPISTGVSGLGTGVATFLATPSSANLLSALTDETGTGVVVFSTSPTLVTPILGTPTSATLTNATGLPLTTGVTGQLPVANGGTGTATPSIVAGTNVTVTGTWPNQTIASSGGSGGGVAYTAVKTANYTAANNDGVLTNTTGGAFTVTLPSTPSVGNIVLVIDSFSQWGTNNLTVDPTGSIKIAGNTAGDTLVCDITGATVTLVYTGATYGWNVAAQVGGNGGTAVTLTGTQTLTNKTISGASNTLSNISLATAVTGNLPVTNLNSGTGATSSTFWRGDGSWAAAGGGKVLQIVQGTKSGSTFTTSATYATSNVFATITPTLNTSKVMVIASSPCCYQQTGGLRVSLYRGTSGNGSGSEVVEIGNGNLSGHNLGSTVNWLDSPASTSALSYTLMQKSVNGSSLVGFVGDQGGTASILLLEIAA